MQCQGSSVPSSLRGGCFTTMFGGDSRGGRLLFTVVCLLLRAHGLQPSRASRASSSSRHSVCTRRWARLSIYDLDLAPSLEGGAATQNDEEEQEELAEEQMADEDLACIAQLRSSVSAEDLSVVLSDTERAVCQ